MQFQAGSTFRTNNIRLQARVMSSDSHPATNLRATEMMANYDLKNFQGR